MEAGEVNVGISYDEIERRIDDGRRALAAPLRFALPVLAGMLLQQLHFGGTFPLTDKRETIPREASLFFTE